MNRQNQLTIIQYPKCGTCRAAVKSLQGKGYEVISRNIVEQTPTAGELKEWVANSGLELKKFFNTSGEVYKELGLKDKLATMSEDEKYALLASNGMLIKRPIVTDGMKITVGYKEEQYEQVWNNGKG
ncbi:arsenate reductase family protein [Paenibacillus alkaliterrae]|uniref:arsenate reductase family protein n=1 Tax=Paenibacillus alkaliterrae TaxID=320909 RepID=UPI001F1F7E7B|nr:arsenate reductase family protein [Paenibacillus alkaliterrae]MCF2939602.1 arsenate reductase family protein [Paenibacillus alkaliterrae]